MSMKKYEPGYLNPQKKPTFTILQTGDAVPQTQNVWRSKVLSL